MAAKCSGHQSYSSHGTALLPTCLQISQASCLCLVFVPRVRASCSCLVFVPRVRASCSCLVFVPRVRVSCSFLVFVPRVRSSCSCLVFVPRVCASCLVFVPRVCASCLVPVLCQMMLIKAVLLPRYSVYYSGRIKGSSDEKTDTTY